MTHGLYTGFVPLINGKVLPQISAVQPNQNMQEMEIRCLGSLDPLDISEAYSEPSVSFESFALKAIFGSDTGELAVSPNTGLNGTAGNTVLQYQKAADGGAFASGSNHFTLTSPRSFTFLESLKAEQDSQTPATAKLMCHLLRSSGGVNPMLSSASASLTGSIALENKYAMGPLYIDGTLVDGLITGEWVTGITAKPKRSGGRLIAEQIRISKRRHELRLAFENLALAHAQGLGISETAGAVDWYLRHINAAGGRTDDTGDDNDLHIRISFSAAKFILQELPVNGDDGEVQSTPTLVNTGSVTVTIGTHIPSA